MLRRLATGRRLAAVAVAGAVLTGCATAAAPGTAPTPGGSLPPVPASSGELAIDLVYPGEGATVAVRDSTFVFGNVGTGGATLTINGAAVDVAPNGGFLAFLPVPSDGAYELVARAGERTVTATRQVELPEAGGAPTFTEQGLVEGSVIPREAIMEMEGRPVEVRFRAVPGAFARLVLPDGTIVPLTERVVEERTTGFMLDRADRISGVSEYVATFPAQQVGGAAQGATIELIRGADTTRIPLEATVNVLPAHAPMTAVAASNRVDGMVIGTAVAGSGTPYHWFFPNGARLTVTGTRGGQHRVALTDDLEVWVDTGHVDLLPAGTPPPSGSVGTVSAVSHSDHVEVRLSLSERLPFRVEPREHGLTVIVYGAETRTNWMQYGDTDDGLIRLMEWEQVADDRYELDIELNEPFWGYLASYDGSAAVVRVRRPPTIDPARPLNGLYIGIDAGHPPGGAIGPTRLTEAEANLAISRELVAMLQARGARVLQTRPDTAAVGLGARPQEATDSSVHVLVSVHNNAFPDGVNPFERNGTSVFYNQVQSLSLARHMQVELLRELGLRDLGIARADLALVRPTWMPSVLTETMFLMVPQQEAALRNPAVQERIAEAHVRALEAFLREKLGPDR